MHCEAEMYFNYYFTERYPEAQTNWCRQTGQDQAASSQYNRLTSLFYRKMVLTVIK